MSVSEKISYLKGLMSGMSYDSSSREGKIYEAIIDALDEVKKSICNLEDSLEDVDEEIENIYNEIDEVNEVLDGECDDECYCGECDDDCGCGCSDDYDECEHAKEGNLYQVVCPSCGEEIIMEKSILGKKTINCPACNEELELDISDLDISDMYYDEEDDDDEIDEIIEEGRCCNEHCEHCGE